MKKIFPFLSLICSLLLSTTVMFAIPKPSKEKEGAAGTEVTEGGKKAKATQEGISQSGGEEVVAIEKEVTEGGKKGVEEIEVITKEGIAEVEKVVQVQEGILAMPASQWPSPLFSFGLFSVAKGDLLGYVYFDQIKGCHEKEVLAIPQLYYGLSDKTTILLSLPIDIKNCSDCICSSGANDLELELEHVLYSHETKTYTNSLFADIGMTFPTGNPQKNPATGNGSPAFFIGIVAAHWGINWLAFTSQGASLTTRFRGTKPGNEFLYQFGVGRTFGHHKGWLFLWMLELVGSYEQRTRVNGICDPDSGGIIFSMAPSLYISSKRFVLQAGVAAVVHQRLFGEQNKTKYDFSIGVGWKFSGEEEEEEEEKTKKEIKPTLTP